MNIVERNGFFRNPLEIKIMNEIPGMLYQSSTNINEQQSKLIDEAFSKIMIDMKKLRKKPRPAY